MKLPDRVTPFLDRLQKFASHPTVAGFRREAEARFVGADRLLEEEEEDPSLDYLLYAHRDSQQRSFIDLFLNSNLTTLTAAEKGVLESIKASSFGFFEIASVISKQERLGLRQPGTESLTEVIVGKAALSLLPGQGIFARLLRYADHYELSRIAHVCSQELAYILGRAIRRTPGLSQHLADPVAVHQILRRAGVPNPEPQNELEAQIFAEEVFAEVGLRLSVKDLQEHFQSSTNPIEPFKEATSPKLEADSAQRLLAALMALWNHTPRNEFQGLSPAQVQGDAGNLGPAGLPQHLMLDMLESVLSEVGPSYDTSTGELKAATEKAMQGWLSTPQAELGGRSPADLMQYGNLPPPPDETNLPPADEQLLNIADLNAMATALEDNNHLCGLCWVVRELASRGQEIPESALDNILESDDDTVLGLFFDLVLAPGIASSTPPAVQIAAAVTSRLARFEADGSSSFPDALRLLTRFQPNLHGDLFVARLTDDDLELVDIAIAGLAASWNQCYEAPLLDLLEHTSCLDHALEAWGLIASRGSLPAIRLATERALGVCANDDETDFRLTVDDLAFRLGPLGVTGDGSQLSFPTVDSNMSLLGRMQVFLPRSDPHARERAATVLTEERRAVLANFWQSQDWALLDETIVQAARQAFDLAVKACPSLEPIAARALALLDATLWTQHQDRLDHDDACGLVKLHFCILLKAIRGRNVEAELTSEQATESGHRLELCRLNEPWLASSPVVFAETLKLVSAADLLPLVKDLPDGDVRIQVLSLLVANDPSTHLDDALEVAEVSADSLANDLLSRALFSAGERSLPALLEAARRDDRDPEIPRLLMAELIAHLGTRRAKRHLEVCLDWLAEEVSPYRLLSVVAGSNDDVFARRVLYKLEQGALATDGFADDDEAMESLEAHVQMIIEIFDLDEDANYLVEEGVAARDMRKEKAGGEGDPWDDDEEEEEEVEDDDSWEEHELSDGPWKSDFDLQIPTEPLAPTEPIVPNAPQVGRNDPCPCGSGKKHKKCCGKKDADEHGVPF